MILHARTADQRVKSSMHRRDRDVLENALIAAVQLEAVKTVEEAITYPYSLIHLSFYQFYHFVSSLFNSFVASLFPFTSLFLSLFNSFVTSFSLNR